MTFVEGEVTASCPKWNRSVHPFETIAQGTKCAHSGFRHNDATMLTCRSDDALCKFIKK